MQTLPVVSPQEWQAAWQRLLVIIKELAATLSRLPMRIRQLVLWLMVAELGIKGADRPDFYVVFVLALLFLDEYAFMKAGSVGCDSSPCAIGRRR